MIKRLFITVTQEDINKANLKWPSYAFSPYRITINRELDLTYASQIGISKRLKKEYFTWRDTKAFTSEKYGITITE